MFIEFVQRVFIHRYLLFQFFLRKALGRSALMSVPGHGSMAKTGEGGGDENGYSHSPSARDITSFPLFSGPKLGHVI